MEDLFEQMGCGMKGACESIAHGGFFGKIGGLILLPLLAFCYAAVVVAAPVFVADIVLMWVGVVDGLMFFGIFFADVVAAVLGFFLGFVLGHLGESMGESAYERPWREPRRRRRGAAATAPAAPADREAPLPWEEMCCEPEDAVDVDLATGREWHPYAPWKDADARSHPDDYCVDVDEYPYDEGYDEDDEGYDEDGEGYDEDGEGYREDDDEGDGERELAEERALARIERKKALLRELMELEREDGDDGERPAAPSA